MRKNIKTLNWGHYVSFTGQVWDEFEDELVDILIVRLKVTEPVRNTTIKKRYIEIMEGLALGESIGSNYLAADLEVYLTALTAASFVFSNRMCESDDRVFTMSDYRGVTQEHVKPNRVWTQLMNQWRRCGIDVQGIIDQVNTEVEKYIKRLGWGPTLEVPENGSFVKRMTRLVYNERVSR